MNDEYGEGFEEEHLLTKTDGKYTSRLPITTLWQSFDMLELSTETDRLHLASSTSSTVYHLFRYG